MLVFYRVRGIFPCQVSSYHIYIGRKLRVCARPSRQSVTTPTRYWILSTPYGIVSWRQFVGCALQSTCMRFHYSLTGGANTRPSPCRTVMNVAGSTPRARSASSSRTGGSSTGSSVSTKVPVSGYRSPTGAPCTQARAHPSVSPQTAARARRGGPSLHRRGRDEWVT